MCGLNGVLRLASDAPPIDRAEVLRTRDAQASRGPHGEGLWLSPGGEVALAHRRLAILDPSPAGTQPMASADGRFQIVYNGETYNFRELRRELEAAGERFRSQSDTEVILALFARHGVRALGRLRGMFALAIWDDREKALLLARDPLGIKPLYLSTGDGCLRFASQVKALERGGAVPGEVDPAGLAGFLLWGAVPEPWTIRRAVRALPAGHFLTVKGGRVSDPLPLPSIAPGAEQPETDPVAAVESSIAAHLVSDVPVAVFLSAGLDSALLAALARRHLPEPPVTFTLRFDALEGTGHDEGPLAAEVARALGTRHVERRLGRRDCEELWRGALAAMDQPSIDGFNTWAVSRAAREAGVQVALSGLGGDELFGGYSSFRDVPRWQRAAGLAGRLPGAATAWEFAARRLAPARPKLAGLVRHGRTLAGSYLLRRGLFLPEELPRLLGREVAAAALAEYDPRADAQRALTALDGTAGAGAWAAVHALETGMYLKNQLLRDADWAGMAHSLEIRVPLVDARLRRSVAAAGFEPARGQGKAEVVRRLAPELPTALWGRPKTGFHIPLLEWMRPETAGRSRGAQSRELALGVLREQGIDLDGLDGQGSWNR
jgi:asparagine synthase (glutamine-hydrolysing)